MNDEKRLLDHLSAGFERRLLQSSDREPIPDGARQRVKLGVMAAIALPVAPAVDTSLATGGSAGKGTGSLIATVGKWIAIGAVAGGISSEAGVRVVAQSRAHEPIPAATGAPAAPDRPSRAAALPDPIAAEPPPAIEVKEHARAPAATGSVLIGSTDLELESESLRRIRILSGRDPERALAALDAHDKRFPHGVLGADARSLRSEIQAKLSR